MSKIEIVRGSRRGTRHYLVGEQLEIGVDIPRKLAGELVSCDRAITLPASSTVKTIETQAPAPLKTRSRSKSGASRRRPRASKSKAD